MCPSRYLRMSSSLARISREIHPLNSLSIYGVGREVAKKFASVLAWRLKISDKSLDRQPSDVWHSSSASVMMKTLEYMAATDCRTLEISSSDGRVSLALC